MRSEVDERLRWTRRFHPGPEGAVRLVCFPHAGGSATYYLRMSAALTPEVEVLAIQYPGRQDRRAEPHVRTIPELADQVFAALRDAVEPPFAFFGHSMGAIVAYEVARRYDRASLAGPGRLFLSGRAAPHRSRSRDVHRRDDAGLVSELRRVGATDERFLDDPELLAVILDVTRNDYRAVENYSWTPGAPLGCPVTVLVGDSDPQASVEDAGAWSEHSTGGFDIRVFPGGHFYLDACRADVVAAVSGGLREMSGIDMSRGEHRAI